MILVVGGSGRLGNYLTRFLLKNDHETHHTFNSCPVNIPGAVAHRLDITDKEETIKLVKNLEPDLVIHAAAITDLELCEKDKELAYEVNVEGTRNIVNACKENCSRPVFISTSNIFNDGKTIYHEDAIPCPSNYYALTKLMGETIVSESDLPYLILRTDQLYSWTSRNEKKTFVERVLDKLVNNKIVEVFVDWYNTPTFTPDFCQVTLELIKENKGGTYHVLGPDYLNRYEWALRIADVFGYDETLVRPTLSSKAGLRAKRGNVRLSNTKITEALGVTLKGITEGLNLMKRRKYV